jgi:hypothetical protein
MLSLNLLALELASPLLSLALLSPELVVQRLELVADPGTARSTGGPAHRGPSARRPSGSS